MDRLDSPGRLEWVDPRRSLRGRDLESRLHSRRVEPDDAFTDLSPGARQRENKRASSLVALAPARHHLGPDPYGLHLFPGED